MTDNEIIKALEEWLNEIRKSYQTSIDLGYENISSDTEEYMVLMCDTLDLINRQKAEIEWLREQRDSYMQDATDFSIEVDKQKAEIENMKYDYDVLKKNYDESEQQLNYLNNVEIPYLYSFTENKDKKLEVIAEILLRTKAEAIKEFAERSEKDLFIKQDEHRKHWMETLNRHRGTEAYKDHEWSIDNWLRGYGEAVQDILDVFDNIVKEMVGEE